MTPFKDKLADIGIVAGQVVFASAFIDPLVKNTYDLLVMSIGISFAVLIWSLSLFLTKGKHYE